MDRRLAPAFDHAVLCGACVAALEALERIDDDQHAVDQALQCLADRAGPDLLVSVYVQQLERLWLIAQRGYDQVRDGFGLGQGVMARAVRTGELQVVSDSGCDDDFIAATTALRSEIALPLGTGRPAAGVLNIETRVGVLDAQHAEPLQALADAIAARLPASFESHAGGMASLARLFVYASSLRTVSATAELAARATGRLLGADSVQLNLRDGLGFEPEETFWRPRDSGAQPLATELLSAISTLEPTDATFSLVDFETYGLAGEELPTAVVWLPLRAGGRQVGVLVACFASQPTHSRRDAEAATLLAAHFASLIDGALALERERRAANEDALTDLLNRRGFEAAIEARYGAGFGDQPCSLLLIDCDDLKSLNSSGGHRLGDQALQAIANALRANSRSSDLVARVGGDEFAMLTHGTNVEQTVALAERIRRTCEESYLPIGQSTVSIGHATSSTHGTIEEMREAADLALLAAKDKGKNRSTGASLREPSAGKPAVMLPQESRSRAGGRA